VTKPSKEVTKPSAATTVSPLASADTTTVEVLGGGLINNTQLTKNNKKIIYLLDEMTGGAEPNSDEDKDDKDDKKKSVTFKDPNPISVRVAEVPSPSSTTKTPITKTPSTQSLPPPSSLSTSVHPSSPTSVPQLKAVYKQKVKHQPSSHVKAISSNSKVITSSIVDNYLHNVDILNNLKLYVKNLKDENIQNSIIYKYDPKLYSGYFSKLDKIIAQKEKNLVPSYEIIQALYNKKINAIKRDNPINISNEYLTEDGCEKYYKKLIGDYNNLREGLSLIK
jgi:hypothetical protein